MKTPMNSKISTRRLSEWTVTANPPITCTLREALSEVDEWLTRSSHWLGFTLRFDNMLNVDNVKRGLSKTLVHIPALGARVDTVSNKSGLYELVLSPDQPQGVVLEYYEGTCDDDTHLPNNADPRSCWKNAGLEAPGPGYNGEASLDNPLMRARLVVFESQRISYLCIGINHGVCDGSGICDILQIWSHYCTHEHTAEGLSPALSRTRAFGERVTLPQRPASTTQELYSRLETDVGCKQDPFSLMTLLFSIVPRAVWCMSRQEELELRVSAERLLKLKQTISAHLPEEEWVSRFEVLCASVLTAEFATSNTTPPSKHNLHVACNLRGRADRFSKDYFGNAAFDFCETLHDMPSEWNIDTVTSMAQKIHFAIRTGLSDPERVCKTKDWFEAARHLGLKNKYDIWAPVVNDALTGDGTFVNTWDKRWLDVNMGSSDSASCMAAFFGILQNLIIEVPRQRESGDSTIYLALTPAHAKRFREFCRENGGALPFEIVEAV